MLRIEGDREGHEKFKRLCALAVSGNLIPLEISELRAHLHFCEDCREVLLQYRSLTTQGMLVLADLYLERNGLNSWDDSPARDVLFSRVKADEQPPLRERLAGERLVPEVALAVASRPSFARRASANSTVRLAIAAGLLFAVTLGGYHLGVRQTRAAAQVPAVAQALSANPAPDTRLQALTAAKLEADESSSAQSRQIAQLQLENSQKEQELVKLRLALRAVEERASNLVPAGGGLQSQALVQAQLLAQQLSQQRDALAAQLAATSQTYESQKLELAKLDSERDKTVRRTAALEAKIEDLTALNQEQEKRLDDAKQYLTSDKDIRELMGARKLYIADVFDVDGSSRTQKPFGRVFYTQGKSLIFYAFDLDRQPGVVNASASAFQVWGQRDAAQGERAAPMNLGILYRDSESNRRWVMRFDEQKELTAIDAVFVTVEPHGGSHTPTSKPFLYALLRNEANHP